MPVSRIALIYYNEDVLGNAADLCPGGFQFVTQTSYCYQISSKLYSAADADSYCKSQNAQLAAMVLQAEMTALLQLTTGHAIPPWVGAARVSNSTWKWNTGSSVSSTFWAKGEPSIYGDCATLRSGSAPGMSSCPCYNQQPALCKLKPKLVKSSPIVQNGTSGEMSSPNYPNNYGPFLEQMYLINSDGNSSIFAMFDAFRTELNYDYLEIYDGGDIQSKLLANFSGANLATNTVQTTGNRMTMRFITDGSLQFFGWHMIWNNV
ncbi:unnamed protein product [Haemonchus placei]|uniref:C-type lectin domain-containing protein n=1 Tax=Haemonchus placei TaxID=6290 RepID=A0A158QKA8_HAEPC|nr:unnamed protein product [Haemonchus placei]